LLIGRSPRCIVSALALGCAALSACSSASTAVAQTVISCGVVTRVSSSQLEVKFVRWAVGVHDGKRIVLKQTNPSSSLIRLEQATKFHIAGFETSARSYATLKRDIARLPLSSTYVIVSIDGNVRAMTETVSGGANQAHDIGCPGATAVINLAYVGVGQQNLDRAVLAS